MIEQLVELDAKRKQTLDEFGRTLTEIQKTSRERGDILQALGELLARQREILSVEESVGEAIRQELARHLEGFEEPIRKMEARLGSLPEQAETAFEHVQARMERTLKLTDDQTRLLAETVCRTLDESCQAMAARLQEGEQALATAVSGLETQASDLAGALVARRADLAARVEMLEETSRRLKEAQEMASTLTTTLGQKMISLGDRAQEQLQAIESIRKDAGNAETRISEAVMGRLEKTVEATLKSRLDELTSGLTALREEVAALRAGQGRGLFGRLRGGV